jgi:hypothetical protein
VIIKVGFWGVMVGETIEGTCGGRIEPAPNLWRNEAGGCELMEITQ